MAAKNIIGRVEEVDFPELGLYQISAKIDTGAYNSSIHCKEIQEIDGRLHCLFVQPIIKAIRTKYCVFDSYNRAVVKSSNGQVERRYKIMTTMHFGEQDYLIPLTLANRVAMRHSVLIGRKFLKERFLVDVAFTNKLKHKS
ncbi:MAG: ATP-dependent zinc protease family protein [Aureispira sp.]